MENNFEGKIRREKLKKKWLKWLKEIWAGDIAGVWAA